MLRENLKEKNPDYKNKPLVAWLGLWWYADGSRKKKNSASPSVAQRNL